MESAMLKKMVLKALEGGTSGTVGAIRGMTAGASGLPLSDVEDALSELEEDGLAIRSGDTWGGTAAVRAAGQGQAVGAQRWCLVYIPSIEPGTFLHLSYKQDTGWFRLRKYPPGCSSAQVVDPPEAENNVAKLRELYPFAMADEWFIADVKPIDDVEFWTAEIEKKNQQIPTK